MPGRGDYQLIRGTGLAEWAVRVGTDSPWGHARFCLGVHPSGGVVVVQAEPSGAVITVLSAAQVADGAWYRPFPPYDPDAACDYARSRVGVGYGWPDVLCLALRCTFGVDWRWVDRRLNREDRDICSQLVAAAVAAGGVVVDPGWLPDEDTPGMLDVGAWRLS